MPEPASATDGVFAHRFEPLGDGEAPWSRWRSGSDQVAPAREEVAS
jgi:hypothetical protein